MSDNRIDLTEIRAETAALLALSPEEVDYITPELLATPTIDVRDVDPSTLGDEWDDLPGPGLGLAVIPNRIAYISEIAKGFQPPNRWNIQFYMNCDRRTRYIMWDSQINRWERDGTCGVGGGRYVYRFKLWWRE